MGCRTENEGYHNPQGFESVWTKYLKGLDGVSKLGYGGFNGFFIGHGII